MSASHVNYLVAKRRARAPRVVMNQIAGAKKAAATRKARGYTPGEQAAHENYKAAIAQAKAQGATPGNIKKAAMNILRAKSAGGGRKRRATGGAAAAM